MYYESQINEEIVIVLKLFTRRIHIKDYICLSEHTVDLHFKLFISFSGVSHHDDLQYLFFIKNFFPYFESDAPEIPMVEISTSIWSNFVINGEPIPKDDDKLRNVKWTRLVPEQTNFLELNLHPSMKTEFFPERMRLWERLFPVPSVPRTVKH